MRSIARFLGFLFATGAILFVLGAAAAGVLVWHYEQDLPDYTQLKNYEPPVMTRVHAADGSLLAEYARERRLYLPSAAIPPLVKEAFISAEDKNFYTHNGIDPEGIARAVLVLLEGSKHVEGASTITQQVAKNFLLGNERTLERKIREALLAFRIEAAYSKDKILELYLNEIFLGLGNYGVAAAALDYYGKSVNELTLSEVAYLAALPKGPNNYHPFRRPRRRDRPAQLRHRPDGRERLCDAPKPATRPRPSRSTSTRACCRRINMRPAISPRKCGASSPTAMARRNSTKAAFRFTRRSIRRCR